MRHDDDALERWVLWVCDKSRRKVKVSWTCTEQRNRKKTRFRELKDQIAAKGKGGDNGFKRAAGLWCQFVPSGSATVGLFSSACLDSHVPFWAQAKAQTFQELQGYSWLALLPWHNQLSSRP
jgi:hypothetical protein